jgi:hypothetical protein
VCTQALLACDCGYATAFTVAPYRGGWLAVMHTANDAPAGTSAATARAVVAAQAAALGVPGGLDAALADQATWLASFFTTSFASIPATALEGACVLQTVKLGAATRARGGRGDGPPRAVVAALWLGAILVGYERGSHVLAAVYRGAF